MLIGRSLSICLVASLAVQSFALTTAHAKSVAAKGAVATAAASGVNAIAIASALGSANYINLRNSVISTNVIAPLYKARGNQPIFVEGTTATANLGKLKTLINRAHLIGLDKEDYSNGDLDAASIQLSNPQAALETELLAAQALVNIASDLAVGRVALRAIDQETDFQKAKFDGYSTLNSLLSSQDLQSALEQLEPQHQQYTQLKQVLEQLYSVKANGGWKAISGAAALKPGVVSADVPGIRQRLADLNYLPSSERDNASTTYDRTLVEAVKLFQAGLKLDADGICGKMCFGALKTSIDQRIAQVNVNLERWRWLPKTLGSKYIFVNLARQELRVNENGVDVISMRTVNGRLLRRTPTMVDRVYEVVLNPYWTVPNSIALKDLIPAQKKDPNYMMSKNVRVLDSNKAEIDPRYVDWVAIGSRIPYTLRQDPGPQNSLGTVKFSLTNSRAIYLHDTPHHEDFPSTTRLLSSGCVRLERPHELAEYLLQGTEYDSYQIQNVIAQYYTYPAHTVRLKAAVAAYLTYLTASVGEQGEIQFTPDYYGQDERMINVSKNREGF